MDEKFPASIYYKAIIVNFEQISHIVMVFPLLTLNKYMPARHYLANIYLFKINNRNT